MPANWVHFATSVAAAFLACVVEGVEALTVVLAVGSVRGWRWALTGAGSAVAVLVLLVLTLGPALVRVPLPLVQLLVGTLILLFGLRWLRKAILRSAGLVPLHDEEAAFAKNASAMQKAGGVTGTFDRIAFATSFNITVLEGTEVIFIVIAVGAGGVGMLLPASVGAVLALLLVIALGILIHRPLSRVPENTLKLCVGVLLSAFGTFWVGEGLHLSWPGEDLSILALVAAYVALALLLTALSRRFGRATAPGLKVSI